jgi:hypothetical protein
MKDLNEILTLVRGWLYSTNKEKHLFSFDLSPEEVFVLFENWEIVKSYLSQPYFYMAKDTTSFFSFFLAYMPHKEVYTNESKYKLCQDWLRKGVPRHIVEGILDIDAHYYKCSPDYY